MFPLEVVLKPRQMRLQPNAFPLLPQEEDGRLNDMPFCENIIERVGVYPEPVERPTTAGPAC